MSDVVVHLAISNEFDENRFLSTVETFAKMRIDRPACQSDGDAPDIMIKTISGLSGAKKAVIFQDRSAAAEFLSLWRQGRSEN